MGSQSILFKITKMTKNILWGGVIWGGHNAKKSKLIVNRIICTSNGFQKGMAQPGSTNGHFTPHSK